MDQRKVMEGLIARIAVGVFGLLTIALLLLAIFNDHGMLAVNQNNQKLDEIRKANEGLSSENEQLKTQIYDLRHNPAAIEKIGREKLKLVRPGEVIITTPETPNTPAKQ